MQPLNNYDDVLTVKELMEILKIGRNKCYKLLNNKEIASIKIGNSYRIPKANIINFIENTK